MARKTILSNYYLFDASQREVIIPGGVQREDLILITNVTDNKVIYNFSDPELTATSYDISTDIRNVVTTRIILSYDTTGMSNTDKLQIVVDEYEETYSPAETYHDSVNKMRISAPQSQIDTDFEYGTQDTKWEGLAMINNNPFAYKSQDSIVVTEITAGDNASNLREVEVATATPPAAGSAIYVQDTLFPGGNGVFIIDKVTATSFFYTAKYEWTLGSTNVYDAARTAVYNGVHYTASAIGGTISLTAPGDDSIAVTTQHAHGLEVGNEFAITGSAGTNVNGSWTVGRVTSPTTFNYYTTAAPSGGVSSGTIKLYPRPQGSSIHRAFDGGVKFSTNTFSKNQQAIRQTKRYFRYQSGKGVAFSTGSILEPAIENIDSITASGTTVTVVSAEAHNITRGSQVDVRNCGDNNYNGIYEVTNVINAFTFEYTVSNAPSEATASGEYSITAVNSYGTNLEIGMMDQQNGLFFRYSNGKLSVVRRTSTFQLSGRCNATNGSTLITSAASINGETAKFSKQLNPGDYIILRGSSYRVDGIISDTQLVIFPDYRGPSSNNIPITKTVETEWEQGDWNIDRCDGTGKTGYTIDPTRMQMFYMDYSWYGAGFIRWGFRATDGNVIYAHKIPNNNQNTEAYMRSGNLPARYEVNTLPPATVATKSFGSGDSVLYVADAPTKFPDSGTLRIKSSSSATAGTQEYINYTSKTVFLQDVISVTSGNNQIEVSDTTGIVGGGIQTVIFDLPFSNIAANKVYYVVSKTASAFTISENSGGSATAKTLSPATGSALSPLSRVSSGIFNGVTREQAGASAVTITIASGSADGILSSATGVQIGQRVIGTNIPSDTFVTSLSGTNIGLSRAVTSANPSARFVPLGPGSAQNFAYSSTRPIGVELLQASNVPNISHWGSSVIMEGRYDEDRAYVYTVGTRTGREINSGDTKALLALRISPSVDNGIPDTFGTRELINRMQLVLSSAEISTNGALFVELLLNPRISSNVDWLNVGGTSLAQYANLTTLVDGSGRINGELIGGEVIFGFYADTGVAAYNLSQVKELSNSILGGGSDQYESSSPPNPSGIFPDGPEVLAIQITNIAGGRGSNRRAADVRISWTEAQA